MKKSNVIFIFGVSVFLLTISASESATKAPKNENVNERTDTAIGIAKTHLLKLEPMETGEVDACEECHIYGISTLERTGRAVAVDLTDDKRRVKVYLGLRYLNATCNCTYSYATGVASASVAKLVVFLDLTVDFSNDDETEINKVVIKYPGKLDFNFQGGNTLGWIFELFTNTFKGRILAKLHDHIVSEIPKIIHESKDQFQILAMA